MAIEIHKSEERGGFNHGWLKARHSFSFGNYFNPKRMNFGTLRVLNEDIISAGEGFPTHAHNNMEIVTIVLDGALEHKDSTGGHGIIKPGDVQRMSAGKGVRHSEYNASSQYPCHLLQVWIDTKEPNIKPGYDQRNFGWQKAGKLIKVVSGDEQDGALYIHQNAAFYLGQIAKGSFTHQIGAGRLAFVFLIDGKIMVNDHVLESGDAAAVADEKSINVKVISKSRLLIIEMPRK